MIVAEKWIELIKEYSVPKELTAPLLDVYKRQGNNIYTSTYTLFGKIPVIRYVCCSCGYAENWVEKEEELEEIRKTFR